MSTRPTTQAYRVCTASRTASHFRFCQPLSGLFGPVGGELLLSPQSVEIIKFGDPGSGR